jgi:hypothetical protein
MRVHVSTKRHTRHNNYPYPCVGIDTVMTQQGTTVQAHPANPVDTKTTTATAEPEEAQLDCDRPAHPPAAKTDAELPTLGSIVIDVQGDTFDLPTPNADVIDRAADMASEYHNLLTRIPSTPATPGALRTTLQRLTVQFSRVEAERIALADAAGFHITDEQLSRDITHWRKAGTLGAVIADHHARHWENGPNDERATKYLTNDPRIDVVRQIITEGGHIDTLPGFVRTRRTALFRHMQTRLLPVYRKAVAEMHDKHKVLLFRLSDLTPEELQNIHCANEYHWQGSRQTPPRLFKRPTGRNPTQFRVHTTSRH